MKMLDVDANNQMIEKLKQVQAIVAEDANFKKPNAPPRPSPPPPGASLAMPMAQ